MPNTTQETLHLMAVKRLEGKKFAILKFRGGHDAIAWGDLPTKIEEALKGHDGIYELKPATQEGQSPTVVKAATTDGTIVAQDTSGGGGNRGQGGNRGSYGKSPEEARAERVSIEGQKALDKAGALLQGAVTMTTALLGSYATPPEGREAWARTTVLELLDAWSPKVDEIAGTFAASLRRRADATLQTSGSGSRVSGAASTSEGSKDRPTPVTGSSGSPSRPDDEERDPSPGPDAPSPNLGAAMTAAMQRFGNSRRRLAEAFNAEYERPLVPDEATIAELDALKPKAEVAA